MKKITILSKLFVLLLLGISLSQCIGDNDNTEYTRPDTATESTHPNDVFVKANMLDPYGTAVRWRWDDRFISATQHATAINSDHVIPVTELLQYLWIGAYESQGKQGESFIKELIPAELQYIGSYIYQNDGSMLLGYAEGGARITLLNLNSYNLTNRAWLTNPGGGVLATVHHEFSHIVHQNYGLPNGFKGISNYLGTGWMNASFKEALKLGCVRNYGALNEYEDFCEVISHFLTLPKDEFEEKFITQVDCASTIKIEDFVDSTATAEKQATQKAKYEAAMKECQEFNEGRKKIAKKLDLITKFYKDKFDLNMVAMRDSLENRIDYVVTNNKIPE